MKRLAALWRDVAAPFLAPFLPYIVLALLALALLPVLRAAITGWVFGRAAEKVEKVGREVDAAKPDIVLRGTEKVTERHTHELRIEKEIRHESERIRAAPGAGQAVPDPVSLELRRALCMRDAYRDRPGCVLHEDGAGAVEGGR